VDATLVFEGAEGPAAAVILNQGGQQQRAPRSGD